MTVETGKDVWAELEALAGQVDSLQSIVERLTGLQEGRHGDAGDGQEHELYFPDMPTWVKYLWLPLFGWRVDGQRYHWCPRWWEHAEAIWRLELLWRSWEVARLDPTGMTMWSMEADRHRVELMGPEGVFAGCRVKDAELPARHVDERTPTYEEPPDGWWDNG